MVFRTTVGLLKAGPSMNVDRDLGTVWGITFFDWINYRMLARPRCAERPGKAEHFTQAERVAVASPAVVVITANTLQDLVTAKLAPPPTSR